MSGSGGAASGSGIRCTPPPHGLRNLKSSLELKRIPLREAMVVSMGAVLEGFP